MALTQCMGREEKVSYLVGCRVKGLGFTGSLVISMYSWKYGLLNC